MLAVALHEFDLLEGTGVNDAFVVRLLEPCDLGEHGAVGPGVNVVFGDGFDGDVVAEDDAHGVVVEAVGAADGLPVFIVGVEGEAVEGGLHLEGQAGGC